MGNFPHMKCLLGFGILLGLYFPVQAQFVEFSPVPNHKLAKAFPYSENARITQTNALPFWDDFSKGIDTLKWTTDGVSYTETIGQNPPSIGAILFDGVDANGKPYSLVDRDQGAADYLISKPFDLSTIPPGEKNSLYLSFFWQAGGKAELPDENDALTLQFLDQNGSWITLWSQNGGVALDRNQFVQEIIQVEEAWHYDGFQFRFFSEGRQSGPFDSWILDYVYLNTGRTVTDLTYEDRALTQTSRFRIGDYGAYPLALLQEVEASSYSTIQNEFYNLENRFRAMEFSMEIRDSLTGNSFSVNANTPFNPVPNALERRGFESREIGTIPVPEEETTLEILTSLTSGDGFLYEVNQGDTTSFTGVDYRANDTVRTSFPLRDFFAYDNGSVDYAAGINQRSGQLAVKYNAPQAVYLTGISINFTNPNQANQAIDILVWDDLASSPIYFREDLIPEKSPGQDFLYYELDSNVLVSGDFYVGFAQFTNDFIHVGLDKTNEQGDKIYYNVVGSWVQNTEVQGALMIRPHIALEAPFEESIAPESPVRVFPNPVENRLTVEGDFVELRFFDSFGREIFLEKEPTNKGEIINFSGQRPGIYLVNMYTDQGSKSFRIVVK